MQSQAISFAALGGAPAFSETQNYLEYDAVNRLVTVSTALWSEKNGYDAVGNRWVTLRSGLPAVTQLTPQSASWFNAQNRISGWTYDGAGNLKAHLSRTFDYDAENRQTSATVNGATATYFYDGDGRRVKAVTPAGTTVNVYDASGALAAEYSTAAPREFEVTYLTADHLGSTRLLTDGAGAVKKRYDYLPFGEEIAAGVGGRTTAIGYGDSASMTVADPVTVKFTGKERDAETGLDYFGARYMSAGQGRWTSPDKPFADQHVEDPQSWNLYGYVRNNPLKLVDDDGESATLVGGIVGGVVGGGVAWYQGKSIWKGALSGAAAGALAGSVIDTFGASGVAIAASGAAGGGAGYLLDTALNGGTATGTGLDTSMAVGTGGALLGAGIGKVVQSLISADAAVGGSIRNVNPTNGTSNCANCAIATDATLAGRPASAMPGGVTLTTALEQHFGAKVASVSGQSAIDKSIGAAGNGARGIVFVKEAGAKVGHYINVVNQKGTIRYLDGQTGKAYNFSGNYDDVRLLRTNLETRDD